MLLSLEFIGKRLRAIRKLRDLTQLQPAVAIGVGKEVVCRTELGLREMTYHEAVAYAQLLCFSLNAFYRTEADGSWDITACLRPHPFRILAAIEHIHDANGILHHVVDHFIVTDHNAPVALTSMHKPGFHLPTIGELFQQARYGQDVAYDPVGHGR